MELRDILKAAATEQINTFFSKKEFKKGDVLDIKHISLSIIEEVLQEESDNLGIEIGFQVEYDGDVYVHAYINNETRFTGLMVSYCGQSNFFRLEFIHDLNLNA